MNRSHTISSDIPSKNIHGHAAFEGIDYTICTSFVIRTCFDFVIRAVHRQMYTFRVRDSRGMTSDIQLRPL